MRPLASVIIPTFNRAQYVQQAVRSVFAQTYSSYEVIVVDDGSSDNTRETLANFASRTNFRCEYQNNQGRSAARNKGIDVAAGDWLMFLDSDDLLMPPALEILCGASQLHPAAGMLVGQTGFIDEDMNIIRSLTPGTEGTESGLTYPALIRQRFALLPGAFIVNRKAVEKAGTFDYLCEPCEDYDFSLRMALNFAVVAVGQPVVQHRIHAGNTPESNIYVGGLKVARKQLALLETCSKLSARLRRQSRSEWFRKMADNYYGLGENSLALKHYWHALAVSPGCADWQLARQLAASLIPVGVRKRLKPMNVARA